MNRLRSILVAAGLAALGTAAGAGRVQAQHPDELTATRSLASRSELDSLASRLAVRDERNLLGRVRNRLDQGDFRPGDRIILDVQGETALTDTFTVGRALELRLPPPTTGSLSLSGVLRSELEEKLTTHVARFLRNPVVRARSTVRVAVQGEVRNAGFYGVPSDAAVTDAVMAAGGFTPTADVRKFKIVRGGRTILEGNDLQAVIAARTTLDDAGIRDGDQFVVPKARVGGLQDNLRFVWLVVSLTGGVYGLSRIF
jgi:protein involved in polysaccharide export with SLBB domain